MCKEIWCEIFEDFISENEREPSEEEMQGAYSDYYADLIDTYRDELKNSGRI